LRRVAGRAAGLTRIASPGNFARDSAAVTVKVTVLVPVRPAVTVPHPVTPAVR